MKRIICFICLIVFFIGCQPALYKPKEANMPTNSNANLAQLKEGRRLYIENCSGCHNLHLPIEYSMEEWKDNLDDMQRKAKISDAEKELIYEFLVYKYR